MEIVYRLGLHDRFLCCALFPHSFNWFQSFIGHAETAHNRIASVVLGFKEALLEEAEKKKDKQKSVHLVRYIYIHVSFPIDIIRK